MAGDALSGVKSITWHTGDGTVIRDQTFFRHTYLVHGDWRGSVRVEDAAGNESVREFLVSLPRPSTGSPSLPPPPATLARPVPPALDRINPSLRHYGPMRQRLLRQHALRLTFSCSERCDFTAAGSLRIRGNVYKLGTTVGDAPAHVRRSVRLKANRRIERLVSRALARRQPVRGFATVSANDAAGNLRRTVFKYRVVR